MKKINIVIARYNENADWSKQFKNVIIYNKKNNLDYNCEQRLLPNVGREGHTYFKHIYDNYDNLSDYTIFLQCNPFDHSPNIIDNLNKYIKNKNLDIDFEFLSEFILECDLSGCKHHKGLPLKDVYEKLFGKIKGNLKFKFGAGAQFIVSKKCILSRPKEFYYNIIKILEYDIKPIEAYVIERFIRLIFK